jgi:periplasmic divalent cation tolerance protein
MAAVVLITTATATRDNARAIAEALVEARLAACVHILAADSVYRWRGSVQREPELLLQIKTTAERAAAAQACILSLHAYDLPEVTVTPIIGGSPAYLDWVAEAVGEGGEA